LIGDKTQKKLTFVYGGRRVDAAKFVSWSIGPALSLPLSLLAFWQDKLKNISPDAARYKIQ
jgi:hypothetical protein